MRAVAKALARRGYRLAYASPTIREIRRSPRPEIVSRRDDIIRYIHTHGARVGPGFWELINAAEKAGAPPDMLGDAAIIIAARARQGVAGNGCAGSMLCS